MFYNENFSNAFFKLIMRFILSLTDLYSATIRFEREFADGFDEPVPSTSSGEQAAEEATEEATDEPPCASPIPELPAPVVSPRPSVQPQIQTSPPPPSRETSSTADTLNLLVSMVMRLEANQRRQEDGLRASLGYLVSLMARSRSHAQKSAMMKTASTQTDSTPSHDIHTDENDPASCLYAASPDAEPCDLLPFEYDPPTPLSSEIDDESSTVSTSTTSSPRSSQPSATDATLTATPPTAVPGPSSSASSDVCCPYTAPATVPRPSTPATTEACLPHTEPAAVPRPSTEAYRPHTEPAAVPRPSTEACRPHTEPAAVPCPSTKACRPHTEPAAVPRPSTPATAASRPSTPAQASTDPVVIRNKDNRIEIGGFSQYLVADTVYVRALNNAMKDRTPGKKTRHQTTTQRVQCRRACHHECYRAFHGETGVSEVERDGDESFIYTG